MRNLSFNRVFLLFIGIFQDRLLSHGQSVHAFNAGNKKDWYRPAFFMTLILALAILR